MASQTEPQRFDEFIRRPPFGPRLLSGHMNWFDVRMRYMHDLPFSLPVRRPHYAAHMALLPRFPHSLPQPVGPTWYAQACGKTLALDQGGLTALPPPLYCRAVIFAQIYAFSFFGLPPINLHCLMCRLRETRNYVEGNMLSWRKLGPSKILPSLHKLFTKTFSWAIWFPNDRNGWIITKPWYRNILINFPCYGK